VLHRFSGCGDRQTESFVGLAGEQATHRHTQDAVAPRWKRPRFKLVAKMCTTPLWQYRFQFSVLTHATTETVVLSGGAVILQRSAFWWPCL
jgi:hypothetical protein